MGLTGASTATTIDLLNLLLLSISLERSRGFLHGFTFGKGCLQIKLLLLFAILDVHFGALKIEEHGLLDSLDIVAFQGVGHVVVAVLRRCLHLLEHVQVSRRVDLLEPIDLDPIDRHGWQLLLLLLLR